MTTPSEKQPKPPQEQKPQEQKITAADLDAALDDGSRIEEVPPAPAEPAPKPAADPPQRVLRKARRRAARLGLRFTDDLDALRQLEARGIDINEKGSILDTVPPTKADAAGTEGIMLPPEEGGAGALGGDATQFIPLTEADRIAEITRIQKSLISRRRRRLAAMFARLWLFVLLPTMLVAYYYYAVATEMYETSSEFVIQKSESAGAPGLGGLFSGTGFATAQDAIAVQGYLTSQEAMRRLDRDEGYIAHFQSEEIDEIQRLPQETTFAEAYKLYKRNVIVGFDPTEGIIRMSVIATDPETAQRFNHALISYAEERIDHLSQRVRQDQMKGTEDAYARAEELLREAQQRVVVLQQKRGIVSAEAEVASQMSLIAGLEAEREQKTMALKQILANPDPNPARRAAMEHNLKQLNERIEELRRDMTRSVGAQMSLAEISSELTVAQADLAMRQAMLQSALQQMEMARLEANRQVRYLSIGVHPIAPDTAAYPRRFENVALGFVIFFGIYIMLSLTISILREQVSV